MVLRTMLHTRCGEKLRTLCALRASPLMQQGGGGSLATSNQEPATSTQHQVPTQIMQWSKNLAAGLLSVDVREDVIQTAPTTMLEHFPPDA